MGQLGFFKSFLNEWLVIEEGVFVRPAIYYGSHLGNLYQMYVSGVGDGFTIKNPHPTFLWQKAKIANSGKNRVLLLDNEPDRPVFSPAVPSGVVDSVFHPLPYTRGIFGFWQLRDLIICYTCLLYYPNDISSIRVYVGVESEMKQLKIMEYNSPKIVTIRGTLDLHNKTMGGYSLSPLDIHKYSVTESDDVLTVKRTS